MPESLFPHLKLDRLWDATCETFYMTSVAGIATFLFGIAIGLILFLTARGGLLQNRAVYSVMSLLVNIFRSIPFIILIVLLNPVYQSTDRYHSRGECGATCVNRWCCTVLCTPG
ncbi:MAG: Methionine import system permease protein MetP [Candidatus Erwinia impunctatus]|nr:Methionine import system permease protein MetP [Culicoides impunctatus]